MNRFEMIEKLHAIGHDIYYLESLTNDELLELYNHDFNLKNYEK